MAFYGGTAIYQAYRDFIGDKFRQQSLDLTKQQMEQNYNLGVRKLDLLEKGQANSYELGLGELDLRQKQLAQKALTMRMAGVTPETADKAVENSLMKLNTENTVLKQRQELLEGKLNLDTMTQIVKKLTGDDTTVADANKLLQTNPLLKDKVLKTFGVDAIHPIDFNNPDDVEALKAVGVDVNTLTPTQKEALHKLTFKSLDKGGKVQIHSVQDLAHEAQVAKNMSYNEYNSMVNKFATLNKVLTGDNSQIPTEAKVTSLAEDIAKTVGKTPEEQTRIKTDLINTFTTGNANTLKDLLDSVALDDKTRQTIAEKHGLSDAPTDYKTIKQKADAQTAQLKVIEERVKANETLEKTEAKKIYHENYDELMHSDKIWGADKTNPTILKIFEANEKKGANTDALMRKAKSKIGIYKQLVQMTPKVEKALKDKSAVDAVKQAVAEYVQTGDLTKAQKAYKGAHQDIVNTVLEYVNAISGQSFTDAQVEKIQDVVGYSKWKTGSHIVQGLKNFKDSVGKFVKEDLHTLKTDYPASVYKTMVELNGIEKETKAPATKKNVGDLLSPEVKTTKPKETEGSLEGKEKVVGKDGLTRYKDTSISIEGVFGKFID